MEEFDARSEVENLKIAQATQAAAAAGAQLLGAAVVIVNDYELEQKALRKNLERLKAERLARERECSSPLAEPRLRRRARQPGARANQSAGRKQITNAKRI